MLSFEILLFVNPRIYSVVYSLIALLSLYGTAQTDKLGGDVEYRYIALLYFTY